MVKTYDVIIIGAGSIGVPTALALAQKSVKVGIIEENSSVGQGQNKRAIGGVRATHTAPAKIRLCNKSIEIFSTWEEKYGDDIEWFSGGYVFVAYTEDHEKMMKSNLKIQKEAGLNIDWVSKERIVELIPGIDEEGLRGGTFSPEDGNSSPLLSINAFYRKSKEFGAEYFFNESVTNIISNNNKVKGVITTKDRYEADYVINAAGAEAKEIGAMVGIDLPVTPDSHESGISEPVKKFIEPLVVDLRPGRGTLNFYFYQNCEGKFIFCLTPDPLILCKDTRETSAFLPQLAERLVNLIPRTKHLKIRRTWRGLYPMTPDGSPIVGKVNNIEGYINVVGLCGQGYMLGPGLGELIARIVTKDLSENDNKILEEFSLYRDFGRVEKLK